MMAAAMNVRCPTYVAGINFRLVTAHKGKRM
jgi:hypothetical protein